MAYLLRLSLILCCCLPFLGQQAQAYELADLVPALAEVLEDPYAAKAEVAAIVVDMETGEELWSKNPGLSLNPASNQKIVTTLAVLDALGPYATLSTTVFADAPPVDGVIQGNVYIRGGGDPQLVVERWWKLASDLYNSGVREITGDLVLDAGRFGGPGPIPGWPGGTDAGKGPAYAAPVSSLSVNYNAVGVHVLPGLEVGAPLRVQLDMPTAFLTVENTAVTKEKGSTRVEVVRRNIAGGTVIEVSGTMSLKARKKTFYRAIGDPLAYAGTLFEEFYKQWGGRIGGTHRAGSVPTAAERLISTSSRPVWALLADMNKYSSNFIAEHLLRAAAFEALGDGGAEAAVRLVHRTLENHGIDSQGADWENGSGLSRKGRMTPRQLAAVLRVLHEHPDWNWEAVSSLAVFGRDGTVLSRLRDSEALGRARVKTGTLSGVLALTGLVRGDDGHELGFVLILNNLPQTHGPRRVQDAFVRCLADHCELPSTDP